MQPLNLNAICITQTRALIYFTRYKASTMNKVKSVIPWGTQYAINLEICTFLTGSKVALFPGLRAAFGCTKVHTASDEKLGRAWE